MLHITGMELELELHINVMVPWSDKYLVLFGQIIDRPLPLDK